MQKNENQNSEIENAIDKKFSIKDLTNFTSKQTVKSGMFAALISVLVIAVVILINFLVAKFNVSADLSSEKLYTLSDQSKEVIEAVKDDITIYYVAKPDEKDSKIYDLVSKYDGINDNVRVELKDPVVYPNFVSKYTDKGETIDPSTGKSEVMSNSLVIVNNSNNKSKYIKYTDMVLQQADQMGMSMQVTGIDVEGKVASAINFVTAKKTAKLYFSTGCGEATDFGAYVKDLIDKQNMDTGKIDLLSGKDIPKDCDTLVINGPQKDFTKEAVDKVKKYIDSGKTVMLIMGYNPKEERKNLSELLKYYSLKVDNGLVCEEDGEHYADPSMPYYVLPDIESNVITSSVQNNKIFVPFAFGLKEAGDKPKDLTISPLLQTSDKAFTFSGEGDKIKKDDKSGKGPFILGVMVEKNIEGKDDSGKLFVFSSELIFDETKIQVASLGNGEMCVNCLKYGAKVDNATAVSIAPKQFGDTTMNVSADQTTFWTFTLIILVPLVLFAAGFVIWLRRRKQ